jgi:peptidoglycan/LPS O-acetylase OafA/YrhL
VSSSARNIVADEAFLQAAPKTDRSALAYRPDIDGLRAVAVLLVVAYHAFPYRIPGGFIGVDIFFVISGFLISGILLNECAVGTFSIFNFYVRRCRRIIPALVLVMAATWLIGGGTLISSEYSQLAKHLIAGATFTSNLLLWQQAGYFDELAAYKPLLHLWSLGVEEQYYIIWPLMLAFLYRRGKSAFLTGITCLSLASFALNVGLIGISPASSFYLLPCRFWELMIGAGLAYSQHLGREPIGRSSRTGLAVAGVGLIAAAGCLMSGDLPYPGWLALIPVGAAAALILAGPDNLISRALLSNRVAVLIGLISYPIYLWHWPLISFFNIIDRTESFAEPGRHWILRALALVAIALGYATWRWVEKPVQRWSRRSAIDAPSKRRSLAVYGAGLIGVAALGLATLAGHGLPMRHPAAKLPHFDQILADTSEEFLPEHREDFPRCQGALRVVNDLHYCSETRRGAPTVAVWGDSHAAALFPGLAQSLPGDNVALLGEPGCAPLLEVISRSVSNHASPCLAINRKVLPLLQQQASIRTVILVSRGPLYLDGTGFGKRDEQQWTLEYPAGSPRRTASFHDIYLDALDGVVGALEESGKKVLFVLQPAELGFDPSECLYAPPYRPHALLQPLCYVLKSTVMRRQSQYRELVAELQRRHPQLLVFDAAAPLCDAERCYAVRDGHAYYYDDHHVGRYGSQVIGQQLAGLLSGR